MRLVLFCLFSRIIQLWLISSDFLRLLYILLMISYFTTRWIIPTPQDPMNPAKKSRRCSANTLLHWIHAIRGPSPPGPMQPNTLHFLPALLATTFSPVSLSLWRGNTLTGGDSSSSNVNVMDRRPPTAEAPAKNGLLSTSSVPFDWRIPWGSQPGARSRRGQRTTYLSVNWIQRYNEKSHSQWWHFPTAMRKCVCVSVCWCELSRLIQFFLAPKSGRVSGGDGGGTEPI